MSLFEIISIMLTFVPPSALLTLIVSGFLLGLLVFKDIAFEQKTIIITIILASGFILSLLINSFLLATLTSRSIIINITAIGMFSLYNFTVLAGKKVGTIYKESKSNGDIGESS